MPRHFLDGTEIENPQVEQLLERAVALHRDGQRSHALLGQSVALIFERPSTRTRVSFEVAVFELGGHPIVLRSDEMQLARGESPRDTALVLSRYVALVGVRSGSHQALVEFSEHSQVPVVNMLTSAHHPCQALADLLTLRERFGTTRGLRLCYVGDGGNVCHSLMLLGAKAGCEVVVATPSELAPDPQIAARASTEARAPGFVRVLQDPKEAARDAHAVYTDVWVSMGEDERSEDKKALLAHYALDSDLMSQARPDAIAMHCLPAHPGEEIAADVLYGDQSAVWDQAENRLHAQKALLELLACDDDSR